MKIMLNRSQHESHSKREYNGIYVRWELRIVSAFGRDGVSACVRGSNRPRARARNRLAAAFSIYHQPSYRELENLGVRSTPLEIEHEHEHEENSGGDVLNSKAKRQRLGSGLAQKNLFAG
jgi:hypothetical protein